MKTITNKTILKQGDKTYQPVEVDGVIYWYEDKQIFNAGYVKSICLDEIQSNIEHSVKLGDKQYISPFVNKVGECHGCRKIVAQSQPKLEGIPVISLDSYVETLEWKNSKNECSHSGTARMFFINSYKSNPSQYTKEDIEKAIALAREGKIKQGWDHYIEYAHSTKQILEQINSISVIEVDEHLHIINYK